MKTTTADQQAALDRLRELLPEGSTVTTVVTHVSSSGMSRNIMVLIPAPGDVLAGVENLPILDISRHIARAGLFPAARAGTAKGVRVGGTGMDMTFHLVYELAGALGYDGYALKNHTL